MKRFVVVMTVWAAALAWVLTSLVTPTGPASAALPTAVAAPVATPVTTPGGFTSLWPRRLLDTRLGVGALDVPAAAGETVHLQVTGRGGVPATGVSAVVLNVTVTGATSSGVVTVYGDLTSRQAVSNLNFAKAQTVPNLVVAQVGTNGKVALYNGSGGTVQLVADVLGYYLAGTPGVAGAFGSLTPSRLLDTRSGLGAPKAAVGPGGTVHLQVTGRDGVPVSGVSAVVLNVTVTAPSTSGYLTVYSDQSARPGVSNLNFVKAQTVPNLVVARVASNGKVALYNSSGGTVQLVADVSGYYLAGSPSEAGTFGALAPSRLLDTRNGTGAPKVTVYSGGTLHLQVTGRGGVPATGVSAVVLNVTASAPTSGGNVQVFGATGSLSYIYRPGTSNLNFVRGQTVPNLVIVQVGAGGMVDLYNSSGGPVELVADVAGWFAGTPAASGSVSGRVTDAAGTHGLANVTVQLASSGSVRPSYGLGRTASDGSYTVEGLVGGTYTVWFQAIETTGGSSDATGYVTQSWPNQPMTGTPTPVTVSQGATLTGINAAMAPGGAVSGTVTDAAGTHQGLARAYVQVTSVTTKAVEGAYTTPDGRYTVIGLPAGTDYTVCFHSGSVASSTLYADQCWQNQTTTSATKTLVAVTVGATRAGINAALSAVGATTTGISAPLVGLH